mgnify:CR=1 FL=1
MTDAPADIAAFVAEFESGNLPKSRWTHEAHLLVALWYLAQHDEAAALLGVDPAREWVVHFVAIGRLDGA